MPAGGIFATLERQRKMLEDDLLHQRSASVPEVFSVISFCNFVKAVSQGCSTAPVAVPFIHLAFYRKTVARLIEAQLLPYGARDQFEQTFATKFSPVTTIAA